MENFIFNVSFYRTTTRRTTTRTTTTKPPLRTPPFEEEKEGYNYPVPQTRFDLPKPTPKINVRLTAETVPVTYLPPVASTTSTKRTTTTTRPTTRKITTTSVPPFTGKTIEKEGYDYPTPKLTFTLPPKEKISIKQDTTRRPITRATRQTTTKPQFKIIVSEEKEGYDYPTPTYLPPQTTTRILTTRRSTTSKPVTVRTSTKPSRGSKTFEGYDYSKPATTKTLVNEDIVPVTYLPPVAETYLPPVSQRTTTTRTTRRSTTTPR
jgi:hypothetical protein